MIEQIFNGFQENVYKRDQPKHSSFHYWITTFIYNNQMFQSLFLIILSL